MKAKTRYSIKVALLALGTAVMVLMPLLLLGAENEVTLISEDDSGNTVRRTVLLTPFMEGALGAASASAARTAYGLGTMSTQAASAVSITGGSVTGITDLAIADGGSGQGTQVGGASVFGFKYIPISGNERADILAATPDYAGQIARRWIGANCLGLYVGGTSGGATSQGGWNGSFWFPGGVSALGDPDNMDPTYSTAMGIHFSGAPSKWAVPSSDNILTIHNWNTSTTNSGSGINLAVKTVGTAVTAAVVSNGGTGYVVGDMLSVAGGTLVAGYSSQLRVTAVSGGVITGIAVAIPGRFSVSPSTTNSPTGGTGTGAVITLTLSAAAYSAIADNSCSFMHVPSNRTPLLIPGNAMFVFNRDATNNKGLAICGPGFAPFDAGNYSLAYFDFINTLFRVPFHVDDAYQPTDAGWADALAVSPTTGTSTFRGGTAVINGESYKPGIRLTTSLKTGSGTGTVSAGSGTYAVTGTGTNFLTTLVPGSRILASGQNVTVLSVTSNTALTTLERIAPAWSSAAWTYEAPAWVADAVAANTFSAANSGGAVWSVGATPALGVRNTGASISWYFGQGTASSGEAYIANTGGAQVLTLNGNAPNSAVRITSTGVTLAGNIELGDAADTTIARSAAGVATIEGSRIATHAAQTVALTADDQSVTVTGNLLDISSNDATASNRTMIMAAGYTGQRITLLWNDTDAGELADSGTAQLSATWTPTQYDTLDLIYSSTLSAWVETARSAN